MKLPLQILVGALPLLVLAGIGYQISQNDGASETSAQQHSQQIEESNPVLDAMLQRFESDDQEIRAQAILELEEHLKVADPVDAALIQSLLQTVEENAGTEESPPSVEVEMESEEDLREASLPSE